MKNKLPFSASVLVGGMAMTFLTSASSGPAEGGGSMGMLLILLIVGFMFYFLFKWFKLLAKAVKQFIHLMGTIDDKLSNDKNNNDKTESK